MDDKEFAEFLTRMKTIREAIVAYIEAKGAMRTDCQLPICHGPAFAQNVGPNFILKAGRVGAKVLRKEVMP